MKSFVAISAFFTGALAAPANTLSARQSTPPALTEITYRVSNLENPAAPRWVDSTLTVNGGAINFDISDDLVGNCDHCLNTGGHVHATRVDILTPLSAVHCNLYNGDKHVIAELNNLVQGADFDGVEGELDKAINADKYSLLCYYV